MGLRSPSARCTRRLRTAGAAVPRRRGLPRPPSGLARFRVRSGVSGVWRIAIFVFPIGVLNSTSRAPFETVRVPLCRRETRHPASERHVAQRVRERPVRLRPEQRPKHDRVVVSLDLRRWLEAPGSGKASPPVPAPTGSCRTRRCWALRSAGERGTSDSPAPDARVRNHSTPTAKERSSRNSTVLAAAVRAAPARSHAPETLVGTCERCRVVICR